jgi:hypothetical protein
MFDFSGVNLPFNVGDLFMSGMELVTKLGPYVLLGLVYFCTSINSFNKNGCGW